MGLYGIVYTKPPPTMYHTTYLGTLQQGTGLNDPHSAIHIFKNNEGGYSTRNYCNEVWYIDPDRYHEEGWLEPFGQAFLQLLRQIKEGTTLPIKRFIL